MKRFALALLACMIAITTIGAFLLSRQTHAAGLSTCGKSWSVISSPNSGMQPTIFQHITAISSNDVWAVGNFTSTTSTSQGLVEHWNGRAWKIIKDASPVGSVLLGVAATASNDVWAVGSFYVNSGIQSFTEHWNGTTWTAVPSPTTLNNDFYAITATSSTDAWAVGYTYNTTIQLDQTLIEHWNGTTWSVVASPNIPSDSNYLYSVTALSATNVWAVGTAYNSSVSSQTLIEHWNGKSWKIVSSPNVAGYAYNVLTGIAASPPSHLILAVGYVSDSFLQSHILIEQWNGHQWNVVPSANTYEGSLTGVTIVSAKNAWAVGNAIDQNNGNSITLTVHWDGTSWSVVNSPNVGTNANIFKGVAHVPGTSHVWAAGYYNNGQTISTPDQTLTELYC